ncbi:MAG TPA: hypothetical protein VEN81_01995 [Planctomycetota bacterium]|nr:hypothetical protein [Planctomycetota bacterium]
MRMERELGTELVEVQFWSKAEAKMALDELETTCDVTVDIVRARIERGDVAYELLLHGPVREVRRAATLAAEWGPEAQRTLARAC